MQAPLRGFSPETFRNRRALVFEALGSDAMVLPAASIQFASRDTERRFRPDSELFYLTGLVEPDAVAVLRGHAQEERFVLFVRPKDAKAELWNGPRLGPERAKECHGADAAYPLNELEERLPRLLDGARRVYYRLDQETRVDALVRQVLRTARARGARTGAGPRGLLDPGEILDEMRLVKDADEIARLRRAAQVTAEGVGEAMQAVEPGVGEWELEATLEAAFRRKGAEGPGYLSIVASGANACVLHYVDNVRRVGENDLVLIDAGASVDLYCGDITRTFPATGTFTREQRAVYDVIERARAAAVDAVRPGATVLDVHDAALAVLTEGLVGLGVLQGSVDELIREKKHELFYPHRTSHWLGLDVHDPGDYARDGKERALGPGMVLTVEPGLYFGPDVEGVPDRLRGIGVRIEDDLLVTPDGAEVLTSALPTAADQVEEWVRRGKRARTHARSGEG
jgi:Xaa-Pro aminopeptidase